MKNLKNYTTLIQALPVMEQAFVAKKKVWQPLISTQHIDILFGENEEIFISRQDVTATLEIDLFILKAIMWGYPNGMRGKNFQNIYQSIDLIAEILQSYEDKLLTWADCTSLQAKLQGIAGLGLSTYTKLLYLKSYAFEQVPSLILDERIIRVFKNEIFEDFDALKKISVEKASKYYIDYLKLMKTIADQLGTQSENLEQFLFLFGNQLK